MAKIELAPLPPAEAVDDFRVAAVRPVAAVRRYLRDMTGAGLMWGLVAVWPRARAKRPVGQ